MSEAAREIAPRKLAARLLLVAQNAQRHGLSQRKQIVEAWQGTIQLRSEAGKGTEVTIELPLAPTAEHQELSVVREG